MLNTYQVRLKYKNKILIKSVIVFFLTPCTVTSPKHGLGLLACLWKALGVVKSRVVRKFVFGVPIRSDTNQAVQSQMMLRGLGSKRIVVSM